MEESVLMLTTASVVDVLKGLLESCVGSTLTTVPLSLATTTGFVETRLQTMSVHALTKLMVANLQRTAAVSNWWWLANAVCNCACRVVQVHCCSVLSMISSST